MTARRAGAIVAAALWMAVAVTACDTGGQSASTPPAKDASPGTSSAIGPSLDRVATPQAGGESRCGVPLPDLSRAAEPVRLQITGAAASLERRRAGAATPPTDLADGAGELGKLLMAAEYRDAAESCFLEARGLAPRDVRWPYYLGHLYRLSNDLDRSRALFEEAITLQNGNVPALVWLGEIHLLQGSPDSAEPLFTRAISLTPRLAPALLGLGRVALARREYSRAVTYLEDALAQDPVASSVHYPLAMAYRGLGDPAKAEAHLARRGQVAPAVPDALMTELDEALQSAVVFERLGTRALDAGDWKTAEAYFRKGLELSPDSASVRQRLGTALFVSGDTRGAMEQFQEAVRRAPDFAKARYSLGVLLASSGRSREALEQLSAAVASDPSYLDARLRLAEVLRQEGRAAEALAQYQQAMAATPGSVEARFGAAITLVRLRRYEEARDALAAGMRAYPAVPAFARGMARLLACAPDDRVRNGPEALALAQRLFAGRQTIDVGETMAMSLALAGQYEQAAALQREVMAAVRKAGGADAVRSMTENLERYERREPCRTPLRAGDPLEVFE